jgi:glycosyltransferase involved in cell wall biosynthesis
LIGAILISWIYSAGKFYEYDLLFFVCGQGTMGMVLASRSDPIVSVIVRTKDRPHLLAEALKSIKSQTYANVEIVVVNDGGEDVHDLAKSIAGDIPLIYVSHETNRGRAAAANSGLAAARGLYLNFLDDDDIFYPDHIQTLVAALEESKGIIAYSSVLNVYYEGTINTPGCRIREELVFNRKFDADRILFENYIPLMSVMFSRCALEKVPGFDEDMDVFEDWDFWMHLSRSFDFLHLDKVTAEYRFYGENDVENSHRQKYRYEQALGVMFEKAMPYLSGRAWLHFLDEGLVGWLKLKQKQTLLELEQLQKQYAELNDAHDKCSALVLDVQAKLDALQKDNNALAREIKVLNHSMPWRITAPLRWAKNSAVSWGCILRRLCLAGARWIYQRLPLTEAASYRIKSFFYQHVGFFFQKTVSYQIWLNARADMSQSTSFMLLKRDIPQLDPDEIIYFSKTPHPVVSIVLPVFHLSDVLLPLLKSLCNTSTGHAYEVILVNSLPEQESRILLERIHGARVVPAGQGKTTVEMWNIGVDMAIGQYVALLLGDILPLPGWLDEMLHTFMDQAEAGLVSSQIILPEGIIWEGGGMTGEAGESGGVRCGSNPFQPEFSYLREVDYCSAVSFMIPRAILMQAGSIPESDDCDLLQVGSRMATAIRLTGRKVFYNPLSKAVMLSRPKGNSRESLIEESTVRNRFDRKNTPSGCVCGTILPASKILVIDVRTPTPDHDSGSQDIVSYFKILRSLGCEITFIPATDFKFMEKYTPDLQRMGVRCLYAPFVRGINRYLKSHGREYDLVMLYKVHCAAYCIDMVRRYCPKARIIFNTVDLHFVREQRQAVIERSCELQEIANKTKIKELSVIRKADCTIVLSTKERELLLEEPNIIGEKISVIPLIREIPGCGNSFSDRKDILFVGGFEHRPNVDAMIYFVCDIWPLIKKYLPEIVFYIVGSKPPEEILSLAADDIIVTGYVPDLSPYFHGCRLSVAPLRYGAGLKGKVATSLSYGLPCVATSLAVEGSILETGADILVADMPEAFALAVQRLYRNEDLWNALSERGLTFMKAHFSFDAGRQNLGNLLRNLGVPKV